MPCFPRFHVRQVHSLVVYQQDAFQNLGRSKGLRCPKTAFYKPYQSMVSRHHEPGRWQPRGKSPALLLECEVVLVSSASLWRSLGAQNSCPNFSIGFG